MVTATSAVIVAGLTGRAGPIVFSPLPVSEWRRMTNNADANQVVAFQRDPNGTLGNPHSYGTDGRGSGGTVDPLTSQGSLTLSADHAWPFAVNVERRLRVSIRICDRQWRHAHAASGNDPRAQPDRFVEYRYYRQRGREFLYTLNAGTGAFGVFAIQLTNGTLTGLGTAGSLPAAAGLNGIAGN